jgi:hypothetical protein
VRPSLFGFPLPSSPTALGSLAKQSLALRFLAFYNPVLFSRSFKEEQPADNHSLKHAAQAKITG